MLSTRSTGTLILLLELIVSIYHFEIGLLAFIQIDPHIEITHTQFLYLSLSAAGEWAVAQYEQTMRLQEDLTLASLRNYLSDVRHFIAWYEIHEAERTGDDQKQNDFDVQAITTPTLTRYRTYLQTVLRQKSASVNRSLISMKRYFGWALQQHLIDYNPSSAVKLVGEEQSTPRHLDDQEEQALVAAVTKAGTLRDRTLIVLLE